MKLIAKDFAAETGVSRAAVSKALKNGRLVAASGLFDTEHPINARFIAEHLQDAAYQAAQRSAPPSKPEPEPEIDDGLPGEEASSLQIFADLGAGFEPVVRYSFDANDLERDMILFSCPRALRLNFDGKDPVVIDDVTGEPLPTTCEIIERGAILARRGFA